MTTHNLTAPRTLRTLRVGVALAVLVALVDIVGLLAIGLNVAPLEVIVITSVLALGTFVGAVWAWQGATWAVWVVAISRALSALSIVPILTTPEAPKEAIPMTIVIAVLSVIAIVVMFVGRAKKV